MIYTMLLTTALALPAAHGFAQSGASLTDNTHVGLEAGQTSAADSTHTDVNADMNANSNAAARKAITADNAAMIAGKNMDTATLSQLQQALIDKGYYRGRADGVWGPRTARAIIRYQQEAGLTPMSNGMISSSLMSNLGIQAMNDTNRNMGGTTRSDNRSDSSDNISHRSGMSDTAAPSTVTGDVNGTGSMINSGNLNDVAPSNGSSILNGAIRGSVTGAGTLDGTTGNTSAAGHETTNGTESSTSGSVNSGLGISGSIGSGSSSGGNAQ
jgi:peptidoglycan hydrolase-like protein with peptidoglycan-binding domain